MGAERVPGNRDALFLSLKKVTTKAPKDIQKENLWWVLVLFAFVVIKERLTTKAPKDTKRKPLVGFCAIGAFGGKKNYTT